MQVNTGVFEREGEDKISSRSFYATLTISLLYGFVGTAIAAYITTQNNYQPDLWGIIGFGLILPLIGIIMTVSSKNPAISFIGYNLIVVPFGFVLGPVLSQYSANVIRNAFALTAGITLVMGLAGTVFPQFFSRLGGILFLSLLTLCIVRIVQIFVPELAALTWIDYISAGIFSLYIGYDMYRASQVPRTVDNAIDISVDLYLDVINLLLTLLKISGGDSDSSDD